MEDNNIKIDDEEYKIADLSDKAKDLVESLRFTEAGWASKSYGGGFRNGQICLS